MKAAFNLFDPQFFASRWICYLDILGFTKMVESDGIVNVVHKYFQSREIVEDWVRRKPAMGLTCFSDAYILFTDNDSASRFAQIEQAARWIISHHILRRLPMRAALACGEFYADVQSNIFIGKALIEAYQFAEAQDWIGLALCRSATRRMIAIKPPPSQRLNYRRHKIPLTKGKRNRLGGMPLYAYAIGFASSSDGQNDYLDALREMLQRVESPKIRTKYQNTIRFLEKYGLMQDTMKPDPLVTQKEIKTMEGSAK
jgi:hypothetical protein